MSKRSLLAQGFRLVFDNNALCFGRVLFYFSSKGMYNTPLTLFLKGDIIVMGYNPNQPRDRRGRWTSYGVTYRQNTSYRQILRYDSEYSSNSTNKNGEDKLLSSQEYAQVCRALALLKTKYGDNFPDMSEGYVIKTDDKIIIISGTFESFTVDEVLDLKRYEYYGSLEGDEDE